MVGMGKMKAIGRKKAKSGAFRFQAPKTELKAFDVQLTSMPLNACSSTTAATNNQPLGNANIQFMTQGSGSAGLLLLNGIIPGADFNQRVGRQVYMKSLEILLAIVPVNNSSTSTSSSISSYALPTLNPPFFDMGRIMILYDRQINGTTYLSSAIGTAAGLGILQNVVNNAGTNVTTSWGQDFINLDFRERWGVIKDWRMLLPTMIASTSTQPWPSAANVLERTETTFFRKYFIALNGLEIQFNSGSLGTSADINTGALWLFTCGALQSTGQYRVLTTSRLRFWDA